MIHQIIYSSASSIPMQRDDLEDLLEQAQANNERHRITGALVYVDGFFLQIIEGEKAAVERLMQTISRDLRHDTVTVLQARDIPAAAFFDWSMAYVGATTEQVARWAGLSEAASLPEVWNDIRQDHSRVARVAEGILSVLVGGSSVSLP